MPYRISYKREGYVNWKPYHHYYKNKADAKQTAHEIRALERGTKIRIYHVKRHKK